MAPSEASSSTAPCTSRPLTNCSTRIDPASFAASSTAAAYASSVLTMCTPTLEPSREGFTTTGKGKGSDSAPDRACAAPSKAR
jgi:hypothetical protein